MALPTFFIIGAPKAGTTSLHFYLDQHPQIQMSANKEPRFFAGPENGIPYPPGRISGLDEYEQLFDPAVPVRGEASTDYAIHPRRQGAPERIKELVPQARFLYLVRDPIERTISHYRMRVAFLGERRTLREALSDFSDPRSPYIWPSLYASQLEQYLRQFRQDRIKIVDQAELLAQRRVTLRDIFTFLSVDDALDSSRFDDVLSSSREWRAYAPGYARVVDRVVAPAVRWVPRGLRRSVRRAIDGLLWQPLQPPTLDADLRARLEDLYISDAERLRALTGMAFPTWSV
jgi:hypothetical protein